MGGFTVVYLKDRSEENIEEQNKVLKQYGVPKRYRFYSLKNVQFEYESFKKGLGIFPDDMFPKDKIKSFEDFCLYWNPKSVGEVFVPYTGSLSFDCYFGRTSKRAMRNIGKYIADNWDNIYAVSGSFDTFMDRGMTRLERQLITEKIKDRKIFDTYKVQNYYESPYSKIY